MARDHAYLLWAGSAGMHGQRSMLGVELYVVVMSLKVKFALIFCVLLVFVVFLFVIIVAEQIRNFAIADINFLHLI